MENDFFDILTLNLKLKPSKIIQVSKETFKWHCKGGLVKNIN